MSARFDRVNLSALPAPAALQPWTYEAILDARMQDLLARFTAAGVGYDVTDLETDPSRILQEVDAFREGLVRQRVNEAVLATSLAYAVGADLDVRAADYGCVRASGETDSSLRLRAQLAWEALARGGSYGGYEYDARSAAPADIADVAVYGHEIEGVALGEVRIVVLGAGRSGVTPPPALTAVRNRVTPRDLRKVNDLVTVVAAEIVPYQIDVILVLPRGADGPTVRAAQYVRALAYAASRQRIGAPVTFGGVMAAVGHDDANVIVDVEMLEPWSGSQNLAHVTPIAGGPFQAPVCSGVRIDWRFA